MSVHSKRQSAKAELIRNQVKAIKYAYVHGLGQCALKNDIRPETIRALGYLGIKRKGTFVALKRIFIFEV